jgi:endonuclease G
MRVSWAGVSSYATHTGIGAQLERAVRGLAAQSEGVYVCTGPVFDSAPETIGLGRVAVPGHTFKVVLVIEDDRKWMVAAIVPNADDIAGASLDVS